MTTFKAVIETTAEGAFIVIVPTEAQVGDWLSLPNGVEVEIRSARVTSYAGKIIEGFALACNGAYLAGVRITDPN